MAWPGYFVYNGCEIVNTSRTEAYARHAGLGFFKPVYNNDALPLILGDTYASPLQDDAPWTDPDHVESYDFYGIYPLDVTGIEDSTASVTITESTSHGGWATPPRRATRAIVFSAVLVGQSDCAVEYGMRWLRAALSGGACIQGQRVRMSDCGGHPLEFLACEPKVDLNYSQGLATVQRELIDGLAPGAPGITPVDGLGPTRPGDTQVDGGTPDVLEVSSIVTPPVFDLTTCLPEYQRFFYGVSFTTGPTLTQKLTTTSGQVAWAVEFTAVATDPMEYGPLVPVYQGFLDPGVSNPYVGDAASGAVWDDDGYVTSDPACPVVTFQPITDPGCALLVPPPAAPSVSTSCADWPVNFTRRMLTIPAQNIPAWTLVVPTFSVHCDQAVSNLRVRFYADSDNDLAPDDLCSPLADLLFSYIPAASTLTFDSVDHAVYVDTDGMPRRRGEAIMSNTDGGPVTWPILSCGYGWVVTVDMEQHQPLPTMDLSLTSMAG
jgi:hypothetical protein